MMYKIFLLIIFIWSSSYHSKDYSRFIKDNPIPKSKIIELKTYLKKHKKYNQNITIFINFRIPSKYYRFFIYDIKKNKILAKSLVAHGSGSEVKNSNKLTFSNTPNSYQSSLGKYKIANRYKGRFGWSYRLIGLDKTNCNAMKRAIVLHPYYEIKTYEDGRPSPLSLGCPMLSAEFFKITEKYIEKSNKPMIIYAFY